VTFTLNVQEDLPGKLAPLRLIVLPPAGADMVPPPQEPVSPLGVATTRLAGRLSENATPVKVRVVFGFVIVKVSAVVWFTRIFVGAKAFDKTGGP